MKKWLLICGMLLAIPAMGQVYKCTVDGKIVYADSPCNGKPSVVKIAPSPTSQEQSVTSAEWEMKRRDADRRLKIRAAINASEPMVSMSQSELLSAMGHPNRINTGDYASGAHDQLIYDRGDRTYYVYVSNGIVSAVQTGARIGAVTPRAACPSARQIWEMEVQASSNAMRGTPEGRQMNLKIADAKACR